jgi:hypothetical protein
MHRRQSNKLKRRSKAKRITPGQARRADDYQNSLGVAYLYLIGELLA